MSLETIAVDVIEGRRKCPVFRGFFYGLSLLFQLGVKIRHFLYSVEIFRSEEYSLPVISVGNLVAGGTGKTPFMKKLVLELSEKPGALAILTRGYRSKAENGFVLASNGAGPLVEASICGDEPYWLACHTKASVWVGKDRCWSARQAITFGAKLLLLEDGFQYSKLKKQVEIVLLDATDLWGKGYFLPRGYLRESPKRLYKADWIVVTRLEEVLDLEKITQEIRRFTKAPILGVSGTYFLNPKIKGKKVGAFCGIAKPEFFYKRLALEGVQIVKTLSFSDHKTPSLEELSLFAKQCQELEAEYLICTEKDLVKLGNLFAFSLPVEAMKMDLQVTWNLPLWNEMLQSIKAKM